jgi:hypothetical protein
LLATSALVDAPAWSGVDIALGGRLHVEMEQVYFTGRIRYWDPERGSGLAVVDIPAVHVAALGGVKQQRVRGTIQGVDFASSVMPAGGGRLALSVSKALIGAAGLAVGDEAEVGISGVGRD